jgi:hypothetical protein
MKEKKEKYALSLKQCHDKITTLPAGEIKFYLFILLNSIKDKNTQMTGKFIVAFTDLLDNLNDLNHRVTFSPDTFATLFQNFSRLQSITQTNTSTSHLKIILLQIGSTIVSFITGVIGGTIGGIAGFVRGAWNLQPFKGLGIGIFIGYILGSMFGFRSPKKLFKDELIRQLKFGLDGLHSCLENLQHSLKADKEGIKPFSDYLKIETNTVRNKCFENDTDNEAR